MFFILLSICNLIVISAKNSPYVPAENLGFFCNKPSPDRWFPPHFQSKFLLSNTSRVSIKDPKDPDIPKACIFHNQFNYTLSVSPGPKFIRLHFYPVSYSGLNISKALFTASVGQFTLFRTSKSSYSGENFDAEYTNKEYIVNIDGQALNITFTPSSDYSDTYGFVNQIDVVSMPLNLYIRDVRIPVVDYPSQFYMRNFTALETIYRLNVGGGFIFPEDDTGMSRSWSTDDGYLNLNETDAKTLKSKVAINYSSQVQAYTAPAEIYATARTVTPNSNMTWSLPLDSSFCYLIRLHFCEIAKDYKVDRVFRVYIGNKTNELQADIIHLNQGRGVPVFRDYVVNFSRHSESIQLLHVAIIGNSCTGFGYDEAILNGLEIFRLSDHSNNLAGSNPFAAKKELQSSLEDPSNTMRIALDIILGIMVFFTVFCILIHTQLPRYSYSIWRKKMFTQWQPSDHCPCFSLNELKLATNNFSQAFLIGAGGFGKVYRGSVNNGTHTVAIKRASPNSHQGLDEFKTEITLLSNLRHRHLVSLVGYCSENKEMILVYDFMPRGTLRDQLYKSKKPPLSWKLRLSICIGAARGLHYLHTGSKHMIIHRDVKTSNILLDKNWVAKVSDLGISKVGPNLTTQSNAHVTTLVKGSFGYLDPEYYRRKKLTEKSDVYSFGVVLFEVLCARPAVLEVRENEEEEHEKVNLAQWVIQCYERLDQIIDPNLQGKIDPECFKTFTNVARKCLADQGNERPSMGDVLWNLELAWKQQENAELQENRESVKPSWRVKVDRQVIPDINEEHCIFVNNSDHNVGEEFSDIMELVGR
ncbi:receptor-like protein kinase FERONIA [Tripterygium wilfordii]|uniref:receptor-like protein kinase FERONIA n=1 Tax=Tripterygium wilfordii TaxID=458696 RepID=UPI0018F836E9|nr:receptor-like protein kinase FERONIA [Tripterygium wilfordii]